MKIALLGASGRTGRLVLNEAASHGHQVTAFVRDPQRLDGPEAVAARVVVGDGTDADAVADAVAGQDAVVVTVSSRGAKVPATSSVARAVVTAAAATGVSRLIFTSTYGMVATRPVLLAGLLRRVFAAPFREQRLADDIISASDTDWTILRATRLTDRPEGGLVRVTSEPLLTGPFSLPRADLAQQLLQLAERRDGLRTILNVTGGHS